MEKKFPGPNARRYREELEKYYATTTISSWVFLERNEGVYDIDIDGFRFLNFNCGAAANPLPDNSAIARAATGQIIKSKFTEFHANPNPRGIDCAKLLATRSPVKKPSKVFWSNSGAEANTAALKACAGKRFRDGEGNQRNKAIYFVNGFAGRLYNVVAGTTSNPLVQRDPFWNKWDQEHTIYLLYPQKGKDNTELHLELQCGRDYFGDRFSLEEASYLLIELPCQGEGGVIPVDENDLRFLYEKTQEAGVFFAADCVQCNMGRTGTLFGCDVFPWFEPDILTMGKALGGGFPIGATIFRADLNWRPKEHSNTFGGNPVTMAATWAALEETQKLINDGTVKKLEKTLEARLKKLVKQFPDFITEVRGMGAMWALEIVTASARDRLIQIGEEMVNETGCGLLLLGAGNVHTPNHAIRIMPPLTITGQELDLAFSLLATAFTLLKKEIENAVAHHFIR